MGLRANQFSARLLPSGRTSIAESVIIKLFFMILLSVFGLWLYQLAMRLVAAVFFGLAILILVGMIVTLLNGRTLKFKRPI